MHGTCPSEEGTGLQRPHPLHLAQAPGWQHQVPGLTLESGASRTAVVITIWSMELEEWDPYLQPGQDAQS